MTSDPETSDPVTSASETANAGQPNQHYFSEEPEVESARKRIEVTLPDGSFDLAYLGDVLEHLQEPYDALRELNRILAPGGGFVAKVLAGGTDADLLALLKKHFATVKHAKPPASRKGSSEWYVIAQGFKG